VVDHQGAAISEPRKKSREALRRLHELIASVNRAGTKRRLPNRPSSVAKRLDHKARRASIKSGRARWSSRRCAGRSGHLLPTRLQAQKARRLLQACISISRITATQVHRLELRSNGVSTTSGCSAPAVIQSQISWRKSV